MEAAKSNYTLILPDSLESRRREFTDYIDKAVGNIGKFAGQYGWEDLAEESFFDRVMIFDDKDEFNLNLLKLAGADLNLKLPDTYCAALENNTLVAVTPEFYGEVFPEGREEDFYEKLLAHEIAHRLHIRVLEGDEDKMGPIWFYEGFAVFAAGQFPGTPVELDKEEMKRIMEDPERGSYLKYNSIFRYFAGKLSVTTLVSLAGKDDFNDEMVSLLNK